MAARRPCCYCCYYYYYFLFVVAAFTTARSTPESVLHPQLLYGHKCQQNMRITNKPKTILRGGGKN